MDLSFDLISLNQSGMVKRNEDDEGFLQLSRTREWILGDQTVPLNRKTIERVRTWTNLH